MGVFDDAIREHLDLKRQHGAPEAELERQGDEAFGRPQPAGEPTDQPAEVAAPEASSVDSAEQPVAEPPPVEVKQEVVPETPAEAPEEAAPSAPETEVVEEENLLVVEESALSEEVEAPEFLENIESNEEHDGEGESEDVLEDTPEFLQESPEHDKMWFEQKPPKDFDFDE